MSVKEVYQEFHKIRREVYVEDLTPEKRTERLRSCIEDLLRRRGHSIDLKLRENDEASWFVPQLASQSNSHPSIALWLPLSSLASITISSSAAMSPVQAGRTT